MFIHKMRTRSLVDADVFAATLQENSDGARKSLIVSGGITIEVTANRGNFSAIMTDNDMRDFRELIAEASFLACMQQSDARNSIIFPDGSRFPLHFSCEPPDVPYFSEVSSRLNIVEKALSIANFLGSFEIMAKDLFDQERCLSWLQCMTRKSTIRLEAVELTDDVRLKSRRGYFASAVWMRFSEKFLVFLCLWNADIEKITMN